MDLKDGKITVREVLRNPQAKALLDKELPQVMQSPLLSLAGAMSLNQVLSYAKGHLPGQKIEELLLKLKEL